MTTTISRYGRAAAAAAVLATALLAGCTGHPTGGSAAVRPPTHRPPTYQLAPPPLLASSWASDGTRGYFVDLGSTPGAALSLYDTAWWTRAVDAATGRPPVLDASGVAGWALPILYGEPTADGTGDTAGVPPLAVAEAAAQLVTTLHVAADPTRVARHVDALRSGAMYASQRGAAGDWASTALAVTILRSVGAPVPAAVTGSLAAHAAAALRVRTLPAFFDTTLPVLAALTPAQVRAAGPALRSELAWVTGQLPAMAPIERLTAASALGPVWAAAGMAPPGPPVVCAGLTASPAGVQVDPGTGIDPQATAKAVEAGCGATVAPPPWTPLGWPDGGAAAGAVPASVAGLRIADAAGVADRYRPQLVTQLTRVWLPSATGAAADAAGLAMLCRLAGLASPPAAEPAAQLSADVAPTALPALLLAWLDRTPPGALTTPATGPDVLSAAADEIAYRIGGDRRFHTAAVAVLARLDTGGGRYAAAAGPGARPSVVATALAAWILGTPVPVDALRQAGLCDRALTCGAPGAGPADLDSPLRATAAVVSVRYPDAVSFPLAL